MNTHPPPSSRLLASLLLVLASGFMLAACSKKTAPPPEALQADVVTAPAAETPAPENVPDAAAVAASKTEDEKDQERERQREVEREREVPMMRAVFGKDYRAESEDALADLTDPDNHREKLSYVVSAVGHKVLPDGRAILLANAETATTEGTAESAHASPGLLNVFFLSPKGKPGDGQWQLTKRLENVAALGSFGQLGEITWVKPGTGKLGLAIRHGYTGQGYTIAQLALFELGQDSISELHGGIDLRSDNMGACGPDTEECWLIDGAWRFVPARDGGAYNDLVVDFSGAREKIKPGATVKPDEDPPRTSTPLKGHARYAFDGKAYKLVEGKNIVPGV